VVGAEEVADEVENGVDVDVVEPLPEPHAVRAKHAATTHVFFIASPLSMTP